MLKSFEELSAQGFDFQAFEQKRQEMLQKRKKYLIIAGAIAGGLSLIGLIMLIAGSVFGGVVIFIGLIAGGIYYAIVASKVIKELKGTILDDMLKKIDPSFGYVTDNKAISQQFRKSGFIKSYSGVHVDDAFTGQMNGQNFTFGEIKVTKQKSSGSSNSTRTVTLYKGPFAFIETGNNYQFTTVIPDKMEKLLGGVGRLLQKADITRLNQKLIKIEEDPDFEKKYAVWTKDPEFAKQLLNPIFREYLKGLASMSEVFVGVRDNFIFFGLNNHRDLFNLKLKQPISEGLIRKFYDEFKEYFNLIENIVNFVQTGQGSSSAAAGETVPPPPTDDQTPPPPPDNSTPPPPQF